ncbi:hemolysin secretion/activation protein ShlB/FhaC/HecB [compost metagenome]
MQNGIGAFDAQRENQRRDAFGNLTPDARYRKYTATISYLQPFKWWDESLMFTSLITGQRSEDVLFSPQRMSLGGQSSIRGYKDQNLTGDSGGYWRNDLRWSRPVTWSWLRPLLSEYGTGLGYDVGVIRNDRYNAEQHGRVSSNSLELFARGEHLAASVTFAHSLERPEALSDREAPIYLRMDFFL